MKKMVVDMFCEVLRGVEKEVRRIIRRGIGGNWQRCDYLGGLYEQIN